jgi:hypothetical protein
LKNSIPFEHLHSPLKFLLKIAILVAAAKFIAHTPEGANKHVDGLAKTTVRDLARHVDEAFTAVEAKFRELTAQRRRRPRNHSFSVRPR